MVSPLFLWSVRLFLPRGATSLQEDYPGIPLMMTGRIMLLILKILPSPVRQAVFRLQGKSGEDTPSVSVRAFGPAPEPRVSPVRVALSISREPVMISQPTAMDGEMEYMFSAHLLPTVQLFHLFPEISPWRVRPVLLHPSMTRKVL